MTSRKSSTDRDAINSITTLQDTPVNSELLAIAWERQSVYSRNASTSQTRFSAFRQWISRLNVAAILLSIVYTEITRFGLSPQPGDQEAPKLLLQPLADVLTDDLIQQITGVTEFLLILLPISVSGLLAFAVKYDRGNNWLLLRGNAEALKTEIYYYLTGIGQYGKRRDEVLGRNIKLISERLKGSAVHQGSLSPFEGETWNHGALSRLAAAVGLTVGDRRRALARTVFGSSVSPTYESTKPKHNLLPAEYLPHRLEAQFTWYRNRSRQLDRQLQQFQSLVYLFGGLGTLLAATGYEVWVATTTAMAGAFVNYLEFKRVETTLIGYNQTADALYDIRTWWTSLSATERQQWRNFELLVQGTEETIRSEHTSWLHDMQDKLAQIYGQTDIVDDQLEDEAVEALQIEGPQTKDPKVEDSED